MRITLDLSPEFASVILELFSAEARRDANWFRENSERNSIYGRNSQYLRRAQAMENLLDQLTANSSLCQKESTMQPDKTARKPWNQGGGLPQIFRIDDLVRVRQDGAAPSDWCGDWARAPLRIVGTLKDEFRPGRVCYFVQAEGEKQREFDPMAEDWLEDTSDAGQS